MAITTDHKRKPGKRGKVSGWSPGAARRNVAFLRSVVVEELTGVGLAATLTLRDCPPTVDAWRKLLQAFIKRQQRAGLVRLHWVMEFQRRGTPHLHLAAWYDASRLKRGIRPKHYRLMLHDEMWQEDKKDHREAACALCHDWLDLAEEYGAGPKAQQVRPISDDVGWFRYLAKHCGRGVNHYQRQQDTLPARWESSPRVWGRLGSWSLADPASVQMESGSGEWYRLRRLVKRWRVSQARVGLPNGWHVTGLLQRHHLRAASHHGGPPLRVRLRQLRQARSMLRCNDDKLSPVRGVSEWMPEEVQSLLLTAAVECRPV